MDDLDERTPAPDDAAPQRLTLIRLYTGRGDRWITARFRGDFTGIHLADAMQMVIEYAMPLYGWENLRLLLREAQRLEVDVLPTDDACLTLEDVTKAGSFLAYHVGADMREEAVAWIDAEQAMSQPDPYDPPDTEQAMAGSDPNDEMEGFAGENTSPSVTSVQSTEPGDEAEAYADDPALDEKLF